MIIQSNFTEIKAADWLNCSQPLSIPALKGKVIVIHGFQMLCPGCVSHGLPQAAAIHHLYPADQVQVIGLHSVFENHAVMNADALKVFIAEYRLPFPVAIDMPATDSPIPLTMQDLQLQGTPSLVLIDQTGVIRLNYFGRLSDMQAGTMIGQLLAGDVLNDPRNPEIETETAACSL